MSLSLCFSRPRKVGRRKEWWKEEEPRRVGEFRSDLTLLLGFDLAFVSYSVLDTTESYTRVLLGDSYGRLTLATLKRTGLASRVSSVEFLVLGQVRVPFLFSSLSLPLETPLTRTHTHPSLVLLRSPPQQPSLTSPPPTSSSAPTSATPSSPPSSLPLNPTLDPTSPQLHFSPYRTWHRSWTFGRTERKGTW